MTDKEKIAKALKVIWHYAGIDGAHHKTWVIDQVLRALTDDDYEQWLEDWKRGDDGSETYDWDTGSPP